MAERVETAHHSVFHSRLIAENLHFVRLVKAGIYRVFVNGEAVLDLNYPEDSNAEVDMNIIMTESMQLIEVQGTAEGAPFSRQQLNELIDLAEVGLKQIFAAQRAILEAHGIK